MNLKVHLLSRITLLAVLCLVMTAFFSLYQNQYEAKQHTQRLAESLGKQLESQLLLSLAGIGLASPFPNFEFWKQSGDHPGICLAYTAIDHNLSHSICNGVELANADWPATFETAYRWIFKPGEKVVQSISVQNHTYGLLSVTSSTDLEMADAWNKTRSLMALSSITVFTVCLLVYLTVNRTLRPTQTIVSGLEAIGSGQLSYRLPLFELNEWQRIATAINQLVSSQQELLEERQLLLVKLINLQEQERRYLARELHDEFGQCLAAINAVATTIKQDAIANTPDLVADADRISRIAAHMLAGVRDLLGRLRPAEFDELGLVASLNSLVADWNTRRIGKTHYRLITEGDCSLLSESQALTLFRITQECLTNIAKHAHAFSVNIHLTICSKSVELIVQDDGVTTQLPSMKVNGIGLLGIRERVNALKGQLTLSIAEPHGLIVEVRLPVIAIAEDNA